MWLAKDFTHLLTYLLYSCKMSWDSSVIYLEVRVVLVLRSRHCQRETGIVFSYVCPFVCQSVCLSAQN